MAEFEVEDVYDGMGACRIPGYALYYNGGHYTLAAEDNLAGLTMDAGSGDLIFDFS